LIRELTSYKTSSKRIRFKIKADLRKECYFGNSESKDSTFRELVDRYTDIEFPKNRAFIALDLEKMAMAFFKISSYIDFRELFFKQ
jgi:hypothetical protein